MKNEIRIRIRPQNLAVLVDHETNQQTFLQLLKFLSMIWGGKYAHIIVVDYHCANQIMGLKQQLVDLMPDVVINVSEAENTWNRFIFDTCRPKIIAFNKKAFEEINTGRFAGLISANAAIIANQQQHPNLQRKNLYLLQQDGTEQYLLFLAATFGFIPDNSAKKYSEFLNADFQSCDVKNYNDYLLACIDQSTRCTWLDIANDKLSPIYNNPSPIVVLVNSLNPVCDLA